MEKRRKLSLLVQLNISTSYNDEEIRLRVKEVVEEFVLPQINSIRVTQVPNPEKKTEKSVKGFLGYKNNKKKLKK